MQLQTETKPRSPIEAAETLRRFQGEHETARQMALLRTIGAKLIENRQDDRKQPDRHNG